MARRVDRWFLLALGSIAVASSIAVLYWSIWIDQGPADDELTSEARRTSRRNGPSVSFTLERPSPSHLVASLQVARADQPRSAIETLRVLLDSGASTPLLTRLGAQQLGVSLEASNAVNTVTFAGRKSRLIPLRTPALFDADVDHLGVMTPVRLLIDDDPFEVGGIIAPHLLAPLGGAVRIDLPNGLLHRCETLRACVPGRGWIAVDTVPCAKVPGLIGFHAMVAGHPSRIMFDSGSPTAISDTLESTARLRRTAKQVLNGKLVGAHSTSESGTKYVGDWPLTLRGTLDGSLNIRLRSTWVVARHPESPLSRCYPGGSLGLDTLDHCELAQSDDPKESIYLRCTEQTPFKGSTAE